MRRHRMRKVDVNMQRRVEGLRRSSLWLFFLLLIILFPNIGQANERDPAEENLLHKQLESISPEAVGYFIKATQALDNNDNTTAVENYQRVLDYAPDFIPALRRMSYVVADSKKALKLAQKAYELVEDNHFYNTRAVLEALLKQEEDNSSETIRYAEKLLAQAPDDIGSQASICQAGLKTGRYNMMETAVNNLKRIAPDEVVTHYYAGLEAAVNKRWTEAEDEFVKAQELGFPADVADRIMDELGISRNAKRWHLLIFSLYGVAGWACGLVLLLLLGLVLSRLTLKSIKTMTEKGQTEEKGNVHIIRSIYAIVLRLTSFYFYISIPVVLILVIAAGGGVIYSFFLIGRIPIKLALIIVVAVLVTTGGMIKSLFIRVRDDDPGPRLEEDDAPTFFNGLREISSKIGAPMVDSVFLVPNATAAVFERGSFWKRLSGETEKCLILGLGLLNGMTQLQLKSILAHEFGHISNRDTAGGSMALHVRRSIHASAEAMAAGGAAAWYNPAWLFINAFYRIFLIVSQGSSRLQEVLADQWAVLAYGSSAFIEGLTHVVRRGIEYNLIADLEIDQAIQERRNLNNLYSLQVPEKWPETNTSDNIDEGAKGNDEKTQLTPKEKIEGVFIEAMNKKTSHYDSHPAPQQRIGWVENLKNVPSVEDDRSPAWDLLDNAKTLQDIMTGDINTRVQDYIKNNLGDPIE